MTITVQYFARLRDDLGRDGDQVAAAAGLGTVADLWQHLHHQPPPPRLMVAVNQTHARLDSAIADGDEVAFFPPVTGG